MYMSELSDDYIMHHGRLGQKWYVRNGPPYPLGQGNGYTVGNPVPYSKVSKNKEQKEVKEKGIFDTEDSLKRKKVRIQNKINKLDYKDAKADQKYNYKNKSRKLNPGDTEKYKRDKNSRAIRRAILNADLNIANEELKKKKLKNIQRDQIKEAGMPEVIKETGLFSNNKKKNSNQLTKEQQREKEEYNINPNDSNYDKVKKIMTTKGYNADKQIAEYRRTGQDSYISKEARKYLKDMETPEEHEENRKKAMQSGDWNQIQKYMVDTPEPELQTAIRKAEAMQKVNINQVKVSQKNKNKLENYTNSTKKIGDAIGNTANLVGNGVKLYNHGANIYNAFSGADEDEKLPIIPTGDNKKKGNNN